MSNFDDILRPKPPPASSIEQFLKLRSGRLASNCGALSRSLPATKPAPPAALAVTRRKAFISYHHGNDEAWKIYFEEKLGAAMDGFISKAVGDGDIDPWLATDTIRDKIRDEFIQDATVTIVLVGTQTWQRRHVDWEISASLRTTKKHNRCGLIGILLPTHPSFGEKGYDGGIVPPRLANNAACEYAAIYDWTEDVASLRAWIETAFARRTEKDPDNSYPSFERNKTADRWRD